MVWRVTAVAIWALWASVYFIAWIPACISAIFQFGYFIRMPRAILGSERLIGARTEGDTLWIAMAVSENTLIEACRRLIAWSCFTVAVYAQYFAAQFGWALRASTIMVVADCNV